MRSNPKNNQDSADTGKLTISFGSVKVHLHRRSNGFVALSWREGGHVKRSTRADWDKAVEWAKTKARNLDAASGQRWITPASADRLAWLDRICGGQDATASVLADLEAARKVLGTKSTLLAAAQWWASHGPGAVVSMTLEQAVGEFLAHYEKHHPSITVRGIRSELLSLTEKAGETPLLEVSHELIAASVSRGAVSARTAKNRLSYWVTFFRRAKALGWWPESKKSPADLVKKPRVPRKSPAIFSPEEGAKLLALVAAQEPQHLSYLLIAGWLGCRPSECQRLRWADFDFGRGLLHIRPEVAGKTVSERWVPVPPRLVALLEQCAAAKRKASVRPGMACRLRSQVHVSALARRYGLRWEIDILRHSRITYRLAETRDIGLVAEESGNSPAEIRSSYKRPIPPGEWERWAAALLVLLGDGNQYPESTRADRISTASDLGEIPQCTTE